MSVDQVQDATNIFATVMKHSAALWPSRSAAIGTNMSAAWRFWTYILQSVLKMRLTQVLWKTSLQEPGKRLLLYGHGRWETPTLFRRNAQR